MPLYIICPQCDRIPVTRPGELCETCQKQADEQARKYKQELDRLERKPRRPSEVLK